jgi:glycosyltransferase involved in cell wall biosynthesis
VLQLQAEAMQRAGNDVLVLCTSSEPGLQKDSVNGIPVWRAGLKNLYFPYDAQRPRPPAATTRQLWHLLDVYNFRMASAIREAVADFAPDVASVHNLVGWSVAVWDTLHALGVPIVQTLHDQYLLCPTTAMFRNGRRCVSHCMKCRLMRIPHRSKSTKVDTVIGVSQFICEKLKQFGYFQGVRRMEVIGNVRDVSAEKLPVAARMQDGFTVFGFIGRLAPTKGIEFLLETFTQTQRRDWKLLVAGTAEPQYERFLKEKFTDGRISFLGQVSAADFFRSVDCTVIPSLWEDTFPSVAFESLLSGRPIIGSRIGGIPELVNAENGVLFRAGDTRELGEALAWASENRGGLHAAFVHIQANAAKFGDVESWLTRWSEVYANAVTLCRVTDASEPVTIL